MILDTEKIQILFYLVKNDSGNSMYRSPNKLYLTHFSS